MVSWHTLSKEETVKRLESNVSGLTEEEALNRLQKYGLNEIKEEKKITPLKIFLSQFSNILVLILVVAGIVSAFIGYVEESSESFLERYSDAIVIGFVVLANAVIGFIQEYKAENAIDALRKMVASTAKVVRDNETRNIQAVNLVPGDILVVETGEKIPADCRILEEANLKVDEAPLTGESTSVSKSTGIIEREDTFIGDRRNMLYMGTNVTYGRGKAIVVSTGMQTAFGGIADKTQSIETELSPLQKELIHVGRFILYVILGICFLVVLLGITRGMGKLEMFLIGISLAVAAIPEGLPATVTIALALGVQKMARQHAIIRKLSSVETLGSTTVICSDKTGTLTQNKMSVQKIYCNESDVTVSGVGYKPEGEFTYPSGVSEEDLQLLLKIGMLCNDSTLYEKENSWSIVGDPTEGALVVVGEKKGLSHSKLLEEYPRVDEIPFDANRKRMTTIHEKDGKRLAYMKGAPDLVLQLCDRILDKNTVRKINSGDRDRILGKNTEMASNALRVLAMAYNELPEKGKTEENMIFVGLAGMMDPPREDVPEAVELCKKAGIKITIITGDFEVTAKAVARQVGLGEEMEVIRGVGLDSMSEEQLREKLDKNVLFARTSPENKLRVVSALKDMGHVVAVTGDGVNDAPALKKSDIGIAMGITGTDVSKEASNMVLTDDNFASIVNAVKEGRGVYESIKKFLAYLFSSNIGEVTAVFLTMLLGFPLILTAIQILWINLVTDLAPALALSVDPTDKDIMNKKPRDPKKRIVDKKMFSRIMMLGLFIGIGTIATFQWQLGTGASLVKAQTIAFTVIVLYQLTNVFNARSEDKSIFNIGLLSNRWLLVAVGFSLMLQVMIIHTGFLQTLFKLTPLTLAEWITAGAIALTVVILDEARKLIQK